MGFNVDAERATSFLIMFLAILLVGSIILERLHLYPQAQEYMVSLAGLFIVLYGGGAVLYILFGGSGSTDDAPKSTR